jgi:methyl acetate hydrolase
LVAKVVEVVRGERLGEVFAERIFEPLGMNETAFTMTEDMQARRATLHQRGEDGSLSPLPEFELPKNPEQHMGQRVIQTMHVQKAERRPGTCKN